MKGAILAALLIEAAIAVCRRALGWHIVLGPVVGWASGYLSWIPLKHLLFDASGATSLGWPWTETVAFSPGTGRIAGFRLVRSM